MRKAGFWLLPAVLLLLAALIVLLLHTRRTSPEPAPQLTEAAAKETAAAEETAQPALSVASPSFHRVSRTEIRISWPDALDAQASGYRILRRALSGSGRWDTVGELASDGAVSDEENEWTDRLDSEAPQQYLYRVDLILPDGSEYAAQDGAAIPASNRSVCLDPGHYLHSSELEGEAIYGYNEGFFTLQLGLALRTELKEAYGIDVTMTRETDDITLGGFTNGDLDNHHLSLRGTFAQGQDLFLSLHTNANLDNANGYPTCNQPIGINKTLVFVNQTAAQSDEMIALANAVGEQLSAVNEALGLSGSSGFRPAKPGRLHDWSDAFNDALDTPGAVCYRPGDNGQDYYGVLRGAASVGVPGLIVEHGFHTVAELRRLAMEGDLAQQWAAADAAGIAEGFGFERADASSF